MQAVFTDPPGIECQFPLRRNLGIKLPQTSRCGIARISERHLSLGDALFIDRFEIILGDHHFTTDLDQRFIVDPEGNRTDRPHIGRHLFTSDTIPPRDRTLEFTTFIEQVHTRAVEFRFAKIGGLSHILLHSGNPLFELFVGEDILHTPHPLDVFRLGKSLENLSPDTLRRRIFRHFIGMPLLVRKHFVVESVILFIRSNGVVFDIVCVCPFFECLDFLEVFTVCHFLIFSFVGK